MSDKPKLAMYWAAACGGCEVSLVNINEKLLDLCQAMDFFFCPCLLDRKKSALEELPDNGLAVTLFNGAIRTAENEEMARLLRRKSRLLVAFGSCAAEGCIPALGNLSSREDLLTTVYLNGPTLDNPDRTIPQPQFPAPEGVLTIPPLQERVRTLNQVVAVDYTIPGCPPEPHQINNLLELLLAGATLPPVGSIVGGGVSSVCAECPREKVDKKIARFYRPWELIPDPHNCLLDQGMICMGIATRDGCGALCPQVNMPCTGCYGAPEGVLDQGASMVAALGSVMDPGEQKGVAEEELDRRIQAFLDAVPDYAGTFYKYSLAGSTLKGKLP